MKVSNREHCVEDTKRQVRYAICVPGGNATALVYGTDYTTEQKKMINDIIIAKHNNFVEQVGFIDLNKKPELQMAGGEFCGNATRSSAFMYLDGKEGTLDIIVNRTDVVNAGVDHENNAWCEIPLYHGNDVITLMDEGIFKVKMNGMISIVVKEEVAKRYISSDEDEMKKVGMEFIHKYNLEESEAVGVMLCENIDGVLKINPIVWVKSVDTLFYETACGSGTTATVMVESYLNNSSKKLDVIQPSGLIINANITNNNGIITKAVISGPVETDGVTYLIEA